MVMDAQPSPQSVGREFVRQYYTLLNRAPNHLFRFYNNLSIFFHDGLDSHNRDATQLVVGQKNIHNKIQQLNFRDVHAKISQVDAQATLGNGVVVQVTGELSNDGQPMRRFTQTFVLAPQSPKNYYVHNDIFRYQDLYSDDENDGESRSENDDEQESLETKIVDGSQQSAMGQPQLYYPMQPTGAAAAGVHSLAGQGPAVQIAQFGSQQAPQVNGLVHDELLQGGITQGVGAVQAAQIVSQNVDSTVQVPIVQPSGTAAVVASVPNVPLSSLTAVVPGPIIAASSPLETIATNDIVHVQSSALQHNITSPDVTLNDSLKQENEISKKDDYKSPLDHSEKPEINKMSQNEPKTYANLFKSMNSTGGSGFLPLPPTNQSYSGQTATKTQEQRSDNMQNTSLPQRTNSQRQLKDFPERRTSNTNAQFGDSHQLFLGNVPHHATEEELKTLFSKFGAVVDLRIHSKTVSKVSGVRLPPNYGFITYEDPESVQNCLAHCPLYFPDNAPDGQKLNVEEKKTRLLRGANDLPRLSNNMPGGGGGMGGGNSQRPTGGPNRSLSNSGGMMRGGSGSGGGGGTGGPVRGPAGGPRPSGGGFTRNDRGPGGPPNRGNGNGTSTAAGGGGGGNNTYGRR